MALDQSALHNSSALSMCNSSALGSQREYNSTPGAFSHANTSTMNYGVNSTPGGATPGGSAPSPPDSSSLKPR